MKAHSGANRRRKWGKYFSSIFRPSSLLKGFISVNELAAIVTYLASDLSSATIGPALRVDGGVVRAIL